MKPLIVLILSGLAATAVQAGSQPVGVPVIDIVPVYFLANDTIRASSTAVVAGEGTTAAATTPRGTAGQTGYGPDVQDAVYAKLLQEAQKRGLR